MAYIDVATLKTYLGIGSDITSDDILLGDFINSAQATIEAITNTVFEVSTASTRYFTYGKNTHKNTLVFDTWLAENPTLVVNGDSETITSDQFAMLERNKPPFWGMVLKQNASTVWTFSDSPEDSIEITGKWGWSIDPPNDILQAMLRLSAFYYRQKDSQIFDQTAFMELGRIEIKSVIPSDVLQILNRYMWLT